MNPVLGIMGLGTGEIIVLAIIGVLLFGRKLPEVGRYLGKGIVEFKKGLRGFEDELDFSSAMSSHTPSRRSEERPRAVDSLESSVPKFEPPAVPPIPQMEPSYEPQPTQD